MQLDDGIVQSMAMARVFKDNDPGARINSLDFHRVEDLLVTAADDDSIHLYNTATGQLQKTLFSKKYGVSNICYTHHPHAVLHASNRATDHSLRYLSLHDNRYLRYFRGHTQRVTTLCMSPKNDLFLSAAQDKQVRLWDLRTNVCQGLLLAPGQPCGAFDHQGLVFAVGVDSGVIKLYDARNFAKGPFDTFVLGDEANSAACFTSLRFSLDGKLMLAVVEGRIYVLDAYTGKKISRMHNGTPEAGTPLEATFSPDGQYVASGCEDRTIRLWNAQTGQESAAWMGHAAVPIALKWAPRKQLVASACFALALWVPNTQYIQPAPAMQQQLQQPQQLQHQQAAPVAGYA